jgi:hypothetical protein
MADTDLQQFATRLGRPAGSLSAFARLTPEQLAQLGTAIDQACEQQRATLEQSFRRAVPWPLRPLILHLLRGGGKAAK